MNDRRPPTKPGRPGSRGAKRPVSHGHGTVDAEERTDVVEVPISSRGQRAHGGVAPAPVTDAGVHELMSGDISSIEADELGPAAADDDFELPPRAAVFIAPPGGLESAAFGDARSTANEIGAAPSPSTDSLPNSERPVEVRKWTAGGAAAAPQRIRTSVVPLPATDHDATPPLLEGGRPVDVRELRRLLQDADRRLASLEAILGERLTPAARAQLNIARQRMVEALGRLPEP
ncbi:MAG: hypothetical protein IT383_28765 [Deltaproteobacteria bacterium]|nr:hypothetical protein [Deltaproteobacteria bacterium]